MRAEIAMTTVTEAATADIALHLHIDVVDIRIPDLDRGHIHHVGLITEGLKKENRRIKLED